MPEAFQMGGARHGREVRTDCGHASATNNGLRIAPLAGAAGSKPTTSKISHATGLINLLFEIRIL